MSECHTIHCPTCNFQLEETFVEQKCPRCQSLIESKLLCGSCHHCSESYIDKKEQDSTSVLTRLLKIFK